MRQWHWLKLIKDYDIVVLYHSVKANIVVDAIKQKASSKESLSLLLT